MDTTKLLLITFISAYFTIFNCICNEWKAVKREMLQKSYVEIY